MKRFDGFKFSEVKSSNLASLGSNPNISIVGYAFYNVGNKTYLNDLTNYNTLNVITKRPLKQINDFYRLVRAYEFIYDIKWSASLDSKQKLTAEDAKFIFEQSEKYLKDSVDTSGIIISRMSTIVTVLVAIIIGLTSYVVSELRKPTKIDGVIITSIIGVTYFYILSFFAVKNILPNLYYPVGSLPKDLFSDDFFLSTVPNDKRILRYYVSEVENYQFRIERNNFENGERWKLYRNTLWALLLSPIALLIIYGLVTLCF